MRASRWVRAAMAVGGSALLIALGTTEASAAPTRNGVCEAGEFCLYYLDNLGGALSDFTTSIPNYGATQPSCYEFKGSGTGAGQCVKNNARSAWNRTGGRVVVYFNSNYQGSSDPVAAGTSRNLANTRDNNASHRFG